MFDRATIVTAGSDLVGWRMPNSTLLSDHLTVSQSGLYVNDLRGVDFDIIEDALSDDFANINDYLQVVHESTILDLVYSFASAAKTKLGSREILTNFDVTNGAADYADLATKNARFVGWLIKPTQSNNIKGTIEKIGLQLNASQTLKIYLYETSQQDPIKTFDFAYTSPLSVQWKSVTDFIVNYRGQYGTRQQYLLGYYEYDPDNVVTGQLTGSAVQYEFDCGCSNSPKRYFGRYVEIQPIEIPNSYLSATQKLPNLNDLTAFYTSRSYGLFAKINVVCDITDVLVSNIDVFAKAFQYSLALRVLGDYLSSKRLNTTTDATRFIKQAEYAYNMYENLLNGWNDASGRYHRGLMEDIAIDFSGMDTICLPCEAERIRSGYISYR